LIAVGTAKNVYLIDTATGEEIARIPHIDVVNDVSFSADGNILATASSKALQFWNLAKIQKIEKGDLVAEACKRLIENFSEADWQRHFGNEPYRILCENLPVLE
jgi:WD40 repeat protein